MNRRVALQTVAGAALWAGRGQAEAGHTFGVEGDRFVLDGKPFIIRSGEMHYARIPREVLARPHAKMRAMGLNTLCMYSFWNLHEPVRGVFDFSGNLDIATFIRTAREEGLWVIVRPGPYSCAEWEFGGYPCGSLRAGTKSTHTDPHFLEAAGRYIKRCWRKWHPPDHARRPSDHDAGGERVRLLRSRQSLPGRDPPDDLDAGIDVTLYTADGSLPDMLAGGTFQIYPRTNLWRRAAAGIRYLREVPYRRAAMCGEYWVGWFDHWGEPHHTGDNKVHLAGIDWMLERGIGFNLYMAHGGTSFGFMNGANYGTVKGSKGYEPDTSSYDYDSPIDEAGRLAPKFALYRDVIRKHLSPGEKLPEPPPPLPMTGIPPLRAHRVRVVVGPAGEAGRSRAA